jgi:hypothetical protein
MRSKSEYTEISFITLSNRSFSSRVQETVFQLFAHIYFDCELDLDLLDVA